MNWRAFDLNLLVVFEAVMQDGSVTRAGKRLGMSQPALSHALNRLRYLVKDQLFIRTPKGMMPTPRAEQLALPLRHALAEMQRALEPETFVAAQANRRFSIAVNNYAAIIMAAPLVAAVAAAAPLVQLDLRPSGTLDVFDRLDSGDLDVAIGTFDAVGERFGSAALLEDRFVAVMRRGHPAGRSKLSAEAFGALAHVAISSSVMTPDSSTGHSRPGVPGDESRCACRISRRGRSSVSRTWWPRSAGGSRKRWSGGPRFSCVTCPSRHRRSVRRCCGTEGSMATLLTAGCATSFCQSAENSNGRARSSFRTSRSGGPLTPCQRAFAGDAGHTDVTPSVPRPGVIGA